MNAGPHSERRARPRRRVLKAGIIGSSDGNRSPLTCLVRDLSMIGARLRLQGCIDAPPEFELAIELDGFVADCAVVWHRNDELGVRFVTPPRIAAPRRAQMASLLLAPSP